jgi:WD40 repeat protein
MEDGRKRSDNSSIGYEPKTIDDHAPVGTGWADVPQVEVVSCGDCLGGRSILSYLFGSTEKRVNFKGRDGNDNMLKVVTKKRNKMCDFDELALTQNLKAHTGLVWCISFSLDGFFVATAGQDAKVIVWSVGRPPFQPATESDTTAEDGGREQEDAHLHHHRSLYNEEDHVQAKDDTMTTSQFHLLSKVQTNSTPTHHAIF